MGYFQWTPNFYIVFVAPPGIISKSTTANIGMRLLRQIPEIKFGPDAVTWQSLVQSLAASTESNLQADGNYHTMSAITIVSSEFGTFLNPNDREMVDVLVSLWDGQIGTFRKATKTMGDDNIENPWINILACTTPAWIAGNFPEYMIGGGFTSRCLFLYGDKKRQLVAYPKQHIPKDFRELEDDLIHDLEMIATSYSGEFTLSTDALSWGEEWYKQHYKKRPAALDNSKFQGYLARKQTHIHKLAMILAVSSSGEKLVIEKLHLAQSAALVTALESHMPKVFSHIGMKDATLLAMDIVHRVRLLGKIDIQEVFRSLYGQVTSEEFDVAVKSALRAGLLLQKAESGRLYLYITAEGREDESDGEPHETVSKLRE